MNMTESHNRNGRHAVRMGRPLLVLYAHTLQLVILDFYTLKYVLFYYILIF